MIHTVGTFNYRVPKQFPFFLSFSLFLVFSFCLFLAALSLPVSISLSLSAMMETATVALAVGGPRAASCRHHRMPLSPNQPSKSPALSTATPASSAPAADAAFVPSSYSYSSSSSSFPAQTSPSSTNPGPGAPAETLAESSLTAASSPTGDLKNASKAASSIRRRPRSLSSARYEYCACGLTVFEQGSKNGEGDAENTEASQEEGPGTSGNDVAKREGIAREGTARRRAFSLSARMPGQMLEADKDRDETMGMSPVTRTYSLQEIEVDIEDMVLEPGKETLKEVAEATPKVRVSEQVSREQQSGSVSAVARTPVVCRRCQRMDCVTVQPLVGMYTPEQVRKHCTADDCWITAHGVVYDVTRYVRKHPGGFKSILARAGEDASADFDFHTKFSKNKLWPKYKIGTLAVCKNRPAKPGVKPNVQNADSPRAADHYSDVKTFSDHKHDDKSLSDCPTPQECAKMASISRASARRKNRPRSHLARSVPTPPPSEKDQESCVIS